MVSDFLDTITIWENVLFLLSSGGISIGTCSVCYQLQ